MFVFYLRFILQLVFAVLFILFTVHSIRMAIKDRSFSSWIVVAIFASTSLFLSTQIASPVLVICCSENFSTWNFYLNYAFVVALAMCVLSISLTFTTARSTRMKQIVHLFRSSEGDLVQELENLSAQKNKLEEMVTNQSHFLRAAAHDLRAPVRSIAGFIQLLREEENQPPNPEYLDFIEKANVKMLALIDDLSVLARIETEEIDPAEVDMNRLIVSILGVFNGEAGKVFVHPLPKAWGVELRISQLFQNLISNALKFGATRVELSGQVNRGETTFRVQDNGIGVELKYHDKIFEQFQRLNSEEEYPGTGIGLTICKRIVNQHGGRIWVESEPGKGATFVVVLPSEKKGIKGTVSR